MPGVEDAFIVKGDNKADGVIDGVAIIATNWWYANQARAKLSAKWDNGEWAGHSTASYAKQASQLLGGAPNAIRSLDMGLLLADDNNDEQEQQSQFPRPNEEPGTV